MVKLSLGLTPNCSLFSQLGTRKLTMLRMYDTVLAESICECVRIGVSTLQKSEHRQSAYCQMLQAGKVQVVKHPQLFRLSFARRAYLLIESNISPTSSNAQVAVLVMRRQCILPREDAFVDRISRTLPG